MVDQTVVKIHRLVCPSQSLNIEQASKFIGRSVHHRHDRSNGSQNSSIGLSVTSIVHQMGVEIRRCVCPLQDWYICWLWNLLVGPPVTFIVDRPGVKIHQSVCPSHASLIEWASKFIGRSVVTCIVDRMGVEIHRSVCPSHASLIEWASKFIGQSVHHRNRKSNDCQNSKIGLSITTTVDQSGVEIHHSICLLQTL
jgi:hypothetical protein